MIGYQCAYSQAPGNFSKVNVINAGAISVTHTAATDTNRVVSVKPYVITAPLVRIPHLDVMAITLKWQKDISDSLSAFTPGVDQNAVANQITDSLTGIRSTIAGISVVETDPIWLADKTNYYTKTQSTQLVHDSIVPIRLAIKNLSFTETDPIWLSQKTGYYTKSETNTLAHDSISKYFKYSTAGLRAQKSISVSDISIDSLKHVDPFINAVGTDQQGRLKTVATTDIADITFSNLIVTNFTTNKIAYQYAYPEGQSIASASTITLGLYNFYTITGVVNIETITSSLPEFSELTLFFTGNANATGMIENTGNLRLNGNFLYTADDVMKLVKIGSNWYEVSRSAN